MSQSLGSLSTLGTDGYSKNAQKKNHNLKGSWFFLLLLGDVLLSQDPAVQVPS
ncbi:UNVERIFIED_CONTAM: hypothetical protein ABIC26_004672, partial [Paenibacillus sp. PvR008]